MNISNNSNLPDVIVRAIRNNWYSGHNEQRFASVTQLLKPTKITVLEKRHGHEITQDASELIWSLMGSAMHKVMEAGEDGNSFTEERLSILLDGEKISGGVDLYENGIVTDFKFTSVWNYVNGGRNLEWEKQLNLYALLYRAHGFEVNSLQVVAIFRDWQKRRALTEVNYPQQVQVIPIPLWTDAQVEEYMLSRINDIRSALQLPDDLIPECSSAERWQAETQYAVYRSGSNRALRLFSTREEATGYIGEHKEADKLQIVTRQEAPKRCTDYCPVNCFCHYYRQLQESDLANAS